jgi:DNA-binding transcriptional regulator YdaS (Cro superfamily)
MAKLTEALLKQLRAWCDKERGRQVQIAKLVDVSPQTVNDWLTGRREQLMSEQALVIQEFLKKQRGKK